MKQSQLLDTLEQDAAFNRDISDWNISSVNDMSSMFDRAITLYNENKCLIHTAFQSNDNWIYDWSEFCND